jgi:hypothetical protein
VLEPWAFLILPIFDISGFYLITDSLLLQCSIFLQLSNSHAPVVSDESYGEASVHWVSLIHHLESSVLVFLRQGPTM